MFMLDRLEDKQSFIAVPTYVFANEPKIDVDVIQ